MKEEKFPNSTNPSHWRVSGEFCNLRQHHNREKEKTKTENTHLSATANGEVPQMLTSTTCEWGLDRKAQAGGLR